jgi:hypothetical protein
MALIDRSERAFRALLRRMPAEIEHNGITKPCVSQTYSVKRAQQIQGYQLDASTQVTMLTSDFVALGTLEDRVSELSVNGGEPLVYLTIDRHPNSAVVHLFLGPVQ